MPILPIETSINIFWIYRLSKHIDLQLFLRHFVNLFLHMSKDSVEIYFFAV